MIGVKTGFARHSNDSACLGVDDNDGATISFGARNGVVQHLFNRQLYISIDSEAEIGAIHRRLPDLIANDQWVSKHVRFGDQLAWLTGKQRIIISFQAVLPLPCILLHESQKLGGQITVNVDALAFGKQPDTQELLLAQKLFNLVALRLSCKNPLTLRIMQKGEGERLTALLKNKLRAQQVCWLVQDRCKLAYSVIKRAGMDGYYADHDKAIYFVNAVGSPWVASYIQSKGDPITDITEDLAAEQKARSTYEYLIQLSDDPDVTDTLRFLWQREIVHFQRFGEVLDLLKGKVLLDVDLKRPGYEEQVVTALRDHGVDDDALINSLTAESLRRVRALSPAIVTAISYPEDKGGASTKPYLAPAVTAALAIMRKTLPGRIGGMIRQAAADGIMLYYRLVTPNIVDVVHRAGWFIGIWTVDDAVTIARLRAMGVDSITSNRPDLLMTG